MTYPEHEKLAAIKDQSQAIGEFLDFGGYTLCKSVPEGDNGEPQYRWFEGQERAFEPGRRDFHTGCAERNPDYDSWSAHYEPVRKPIQTLLAEYFGIDQDKLEQEKRAMLAACRP